MADAALRLRDRRRWLGLTQKELAEKANVSLKTINDWEAGKHQPVPGPQLRAVAAALGVDPGWLLGEPVEIEEEEGPFL